MPDLAPIEVSMSWHSDGETIVFDGCRMVTPADRMRGQGVIVDRIEETPDGIMVHGQMATWVQPYVVSRDEVPTTSGTGLLTQAGADMENGSVVRIQRAEYFRYGPDVMAQFPAGSRVGAPIFPSLGDSADEYTERFDLQPTETCWKDSSSSGMECGKASDPASETGLCSDHLREIRDRVKLTD